MATARKDLLDLDDPGWVHCTNRCVRRAFLCGVDTYSQRNYEHRKDWIAFRLGRAAQAFCVDVAAYAAMENHVHIVVRMRPDDAERLDDLEVVDRWLSVFPGFREGRPEVDADPGEVPTPRPGLREEMLADADRIALCRQRLADLSWFMRVITEPIARWANAEDEVTGRFWEGRFRTDPILDWEGLLASMIYVDLNPVRAGVAATPETSEFTSGQHRSRALAQATTGEQRPPQAVTERMLRPHLDWLMPVERLSAYDAVAGSGGWRECDYLTLLERSGRTIRSDKHGFIDPELPGILERLGIDAHRWGDHMRIPGALRGTVGRPNRLAAEARRRGRAFVRSCRQLFASDHPN